MGKGCKLKGLMGKGRCWQPHFCIQILKKGLYNTSTLRASQEKCFHWIIYSLHNWQVLTLVLYGALALGAALPQMGVFISASFSAGSVFSMIKEVSIYMLNRESKSQFNVFTCS